ncbi:MAG: peptidylprolyl isomerase, partial [Planctomycetota bacterium]
WRIAYEATVALGRFAPLLRQERGAAPALTQALTALRAAVENPSPHVRAGAMEALAGFSDEDDVLTLLQRGRLDLSVSVRAAALRTRVKLSAPADALETLARGAKDDDPVVRAAAADAAGASEDPAVVPILLQLARDPSLFVATRAVEQLGAHPGDEARRALHGFLAHADNGVRLAAVLALKEMASPDDASVLALAAGTSQGDIGAEVAFNALEVLAKIATPEARATVEAAQDDARPHVRAVARRLMRDTFGATPRSEEPALAEPLPLPVPGKDHPLYRFNPLVELDTTRGTMVFELFPLEAPLHVHNFLTLIERGAYDGLTFHRVVPDFVIQGGDHRGDGNGARPWQGDALRAEFTPRKYTRGSLGMPRNEDPDSGGSQFFVTHLPTPHLDGRYTIFGELRAGGEVLDQLEIGDRILSAKLLR